MREVQRPTVANLQAAENQLVLAESSIAEKETETLQILRMFRDLCDGVSYFDGRMKSLEQSLERQLSGKVKRLEDKLSRFRETCARFAEGVRVQREVESGTVNFLPEVNEYGSEEEYPHQHCGTTKTAYESRKNTLSISHQLSRNAASVECPFVCCHKP